jgi:hypothetical protein
VPDQKLFERWKQADEKARAAEAGLREDFSRFEQGAGSEPTLERVLQVKLLRASASELLDKYIRTAGERGTNANSGWHHSD